MYCFLDATLNQWLTCRTTVWMFEFLRYWQLSFKNTYGAIGKGIWQLSFKNIYVWKEPGKGIDSFPLRAVQHCSELLELLCQALKHNDARDYVMSKRVDPCWTNMFYSLNCHQLCLQKSTKILIYVSDCRIKLAEKYNTNLDISWRILTVYACLVFMTWL